MGNVIRKKRSASSRCTGLTTMDTVSKAITVENNTVYEKKHPIPMSSGMILLVRVTL